MNHAKELRRIADAIRKGEYSVHAQAIERIAAEMEAEASKPDPLGEALNSGDGTYRP